MIIDGQKNLRRFKGFLKNVHVMIVSILSYQIPGTAPNMDVTWSIKRKSAFFGRSENNFPKDVHNSQWVKNTVIWNLNIHWQSEINPSAITSCLYILSPRS